MEETNNMYSKFLNFYLFKYTGLNAKNFMKCVGEQNDTVLVCP
jgi:hypothetical protein